VASGALIILTSLQRRGWLAFNRQKSVAAAGRGDGRREVRYSPSSCEAPHDGAVVPRPRVRVVDETRILIGVDDGG
jgi:hypothetical protein